MALLNTPQRLLNALHARRLARRLARASAILQIEGLPAQLGQGARFPLRLQLHAEQSGWPTWLFTPHARRPQLISRWHPSASARSTATPGAHSHLEIDAQQSDALRQGTLTLNIDAPRTPGHYRLALSIEMPGRAAAGIAASRIHWAGETYITGDNLYHERPEIAPEDAHRWLSHEGRSRPIMIICETVNACNLACIICAYSIMERPKKVMDMDTFRRVLDSYRAMGGGALSLTPMVGDIFLDKRLGERLRLLADYPEIGPLSVTTNGVLAARLDEPELRHILTCLNVVTLSVYGLDAEEFHAMTRKDAYDEMLAGLRRIVALIDDRSKLRFGFRLLKRRPDEVVRAWLNDTLGLDAPFSAIGDYYNWGVFDTSQALPFDAKWIIRTPPKTQCLIPTVALQIFSNGEVSFCHCDDFNGDADLKLGNIRQQSLLDMYNSDKAKRLMNFEQHMPDFCRRCTFHRPLSDIRHLPWIYEHPTNFIGG